MLAALFANLGIAVAKFAGFLITRASSMLAEAIHSLADCGNQALLLFGGRQARRPATPRHPFGYGRERYFWSFVVAVVLFSVGGLFAVYEGAEKLRHPHEIASPAVALGILVFGILLEGFSLRTAIVESNTVRGTASWWGFIRNARNPELPVVLLEDLGAMIGLVFALLGVSLAAVTGDPLYDALGTLLIGLLLCAVAVVLAVEMKSLLIGESATEDATARIRDALASSPGIAAVLHLETQHLGPDELLVGAKVQLAEEQSLADAVACIDAAEARVREAVPEARVLYVEPDTPVEAS